MSLGGIGSSAANQHIGRSRHQGGLDASQSGGPVPEAFDTEEIQKAKKGIKAKSTTEIQEIKDVQDSQKTDGAQQAKRPDVARQMSKKDILDHLLNLGRQFNDHSENVVTTLLEYGLAASSENYDTIERLLKGRKDTSSVQSAVATLSKGLEGAPKAVDLFSSFFTNASQFSQQAASLSSMMAQFSQSLAGAKQLLNPGLYAGIGAVMSELDDTLKKLSGKVGKDGFSLTALGHKGMVTDLKTFYEFLTGLAQKIQLSDQNKQSQQLLTQLNMLQGKIGDFLENITLQAMLSQSPKEQGAGHSNFAYWQIPNPIVAASKHVDLLIKKDKKKREKEIDPDKTRVVLRFETPSLGLIAIILDVIDRRVWTTIHAERPGAKDTIHKMTAEFRDRFDTLNYQMVGFKVTENRLDLKQLLLPRQSLDGLSRISAEI